MSRRPPGILRWAVPVAVVTVLAGCGQGGQGTAATTSPASPTVTAAATQIAAVPEAPPSFPGFVAAPALSTGSYVESDRIAGATLLIKAALPDHTADCSRTGTETDPAELDAGYFGAGQVAPALGSAGFVVGWGQCQTTADRQRGTVALTLELSDPAAAQWAADRLVAEQVTLLGQFRPTPQADVNGLPMDPVDLQNHAVTLPGDLDMVVGPFGVESYLRLATDPVRERDTLTANRSTGTFVKQSRDDKLGYAITLYRFPDPARAGAASTAYADIEGGAPGRTRFTVASVPTASCFVRPDTSGSFTQRCYVSAGDRLAALDVSKLTTAGDTAAMTRLLPQQRAAL